MSNEESGALLFSKELYCATSGLTSAPAAWAALIASKAVSAELEGEAEPTTPDMANASIEAKVTINNTALYRLENTSCLTYVTRKVQGPTHAILI